MSETKAPIIIKRKAAHGGHHGGAWKVAYADFVTAMMALFIVLWLMNSNAQVKEAVAGYFKDPAGQGKLAGSEAGGQGGSSLSLSKDDMKGLKDKLASALQATPSFQKIKDNVEMTVTGEGLRIELLETEKGMFFESGRPQPTERGRELLVRLAEELGSLPNALVIEGHTDSKPFSNGGAYSNWELSADRANQARQLMQQKGLRADQVMQVRGFADQHLRNSKDPEAASNRRVSVIVRYREPEANSPAAPASASALPAASAPASAHPAESAHPAASAHPPASALPAASAHPAESAHAAAPAGGHGQ